MTALILGAADFFELDSDALTSHVKALIGKPLRRAGVLSSLALLASRRCIERETWLNASPPSDLPTALLWHTKSFMNNEAEPLIKAMVGEGEAVMPFAFLASQPALIGVTIAPWMPPLHTVIGLPWIDSDGQDIWQRSLQLAVAMLANGSCRRLLCAHLDRETPRHRIHTLSLLSASESVSPLGYVEIRGEKGLQAPMAARDFIDRLRHWLACPEPNSGSGMLGSGPLHIALRRTPFDSRNTDRDLNLR
jgi:hypothetical protein